MSAPQPVLVAQELREIRIAGFGGQGVILAGFIIGKAASLYDGQEATMTQAYGPESRGGACSADVVMGKGEIGYPKVKSPHVLVAMSQEAYALNAPHVRPDGLIIIDADLVKIEAPPAARLLAVPATRLAEQLGKKVVANIILLGFFTAQARLLSQDAMRKAIQSSVPARFTSLNLRAFEVGFEHGLKA
jgi:2-oxoglutarate ferredoxin oxidoreductase subunit gamma